MSGLTITGDDMAGAFGVSSMSYGSARGGIGGFFDDVVSGAKRAVTAVRTELDLPPITVRSAVEAAGKKGGEQTVGGVLRWLRGGSGGSAGAAAGEAIAQKGEEAASRIRQAKQGGALYNAATSPFTILAVIAGLALFFGSRR